MVRVTEKQLLGSFNFTFLEPHVASGAGAVGTGHLDLARATVCEPWKEAAEPSGTHVLTETSKRSEEPRAQPWRVWPPDRS